MPADYTYRRSALAALSGFAHGAKVTQITPKLCRSHYLHPRQPVKPRVGTYVGRPLRLSVLGGTAFSGGAAIRTALRDRWGPSDIDSKINQGASVSQSYRLARPA